MPYILGFSGRVVKEFNAKSNGIFLLIRGGVNQFLSSVSLGITIYVSVRRKHALLDAFVVMNRTAMAQWLTRFI